MTHVYTYSTCMSICIFKNTLPSFLVYSVGVCLNVLTCNGKVVCVWQSCVGGNGNSSVLCCLCQSVYVICVKHCFLLSQFLIIVQDRDSGQEKLGSK